jgi:hypothetical protein
MVARDMDREMRERTSVSPYQAYSAATVSHGHCLEGLVHRTRLLNDDRGAPQQILASSPRRACRVRIKVVSLERVWAANGPALDCKEAAECLLFHLASLAPPAIGCSDAEMQNWSIISCRLCRRLLQFAEFHHIVPHNCPSGSLLDQGLDRNTSRRPTISILARLPRRGKPFASPRQVSLVR